MLPFSKAADLENSAETVSFPKLVDDGHVNTDFSEQLDNYFNKKLPARNHG